MKRQGENPNAVTVRQLMDLHIFKKYMHLVAGEGGEKAPSGSGGGDDAAAIS